MDIESEEGIRSVVLRRSETSGMGLGLGFSIMGGAGYEFPPVIYGIEKDSPAARSGMLEAGDVILSINEREVVKLSTKEVLKCLRLSGDIVHIKFKRDPHVVSRVRQFLSAPSYLEGHDNHHISHQSSPLKQSRTNKKGSQIPVYQYQNPAQSPPALSPNSRSTSIPPYSPSFAGGDGDHITISTKQSSPGHISFTDELFINHSFQHQNLVCQHSPSNKPNKQILQKQSEIENSKNQAGGGGGGNKNGRKNFETFLMTGDAILNLSRNDSNDSYKPSPTKTCSKLTPMPHMPHMPIFVERDKDYNRRIQLGKEMERREKEKDKSESDAVSPPLPPPPQLEEMSQAANESNSYSSDKNKSDHLPPPPPPDLGESGGLVEKSSSLKNGHSNGENGQANLCNNVVHVNNSRGKDVVNNVANNNESSNRCPNHQMNSNYNNEDTSISSSVMSDSGDEVPEDEDVKKMMASSSDGCATNRIVLKVEARKTNSADSFDAERERDSEFAEVVAEKTSIRERERYNEYIMLNGSRGTLNEDDMSGSGRHSAQQYSYSQAINKDEKTPSTVTGGQDHSGGESEGEVDESNSENDIVGIGCDKSGGHVGGGSGGSFSGGESDSSDVESMRIAPVTKAVDVPSAERLAKRLYQLDGFKATDVWRHLSKNTDFNRIVALEYLKFFEFKDETLDVSLRKFLAVCPLRGETQDRERVLSYFSARYVESNPETFGTQDSVHTLTCALMLLNTDIYSGIRNQRMTCSEFIENLSGLNEGGDFPRDVLKQLYLSIRSQPLVSPSDADDDESNKDILPMDPPVASMSVEFKRGYLVRKCTFEYGGKKTPLGKRSWKMFFCRLKELLLVLSPDETNKAPVQSAHQIKLHHAFATLASDYRKRRNVLRLILADRSQFLFQSSDTREMHSWIDMINWNAARFSSPALEAPCSSTGKFERPLLPSCATRMSRREQVGTHQAALNHWEQEMETLTQPKKKGSSSTARKEDKEKLTFYQFEIRRYRTYIEILEKRAASESSERNGGDELVELQVLPNPPVLMEEES